MRRVRLTDYYMVLVALLVTLAAERYSHHDWHRSWALALSTAVCTCLLVLLAQFLFLERVGPSAEADILGDLMVALFYFAAPVTIVGVAGTLVTDVATAHHPLWLALLMGFGLSTVVVVIGMVIGNGNVMDTATFSCSCSGCAVFLWVIAAIILASLHHRRAVSPTRPGTKHTQVAPNERPGPAMTGPGRAPSQAADG